MPYRVALIRAAGLIVAISLLLSVSPELASADDLTRGKSRAAFIAVGHESDVFDGNRFARCICPNTSDIDLGSVAITPAFSWYYRNTHLPIGPHKLYRLNVVLLI